MKFGEKEIFESKKYTGFFLADVVAINPTREQLSVAKGFELKEPAEGKEPLKDFEYEGKTNEGDDYIDIVFYLKAINHADKPIMPIRFRLVDKDVVSEKEENGVKVSKQQWVNAAGGQTWVDDKKNLLDKFTKVQVKGQNVADRSYREAIQGEGNYYGFLQAWLDKGVAFYGETSVDTDIFIDKKAAFRNIEKYVDKELRPLIGSERVGKFSALCMVGIQEKEGKISHFQNVYNSFWPEWKFKSIGSAVSSGNWSLSAETIKQHEYLVKSLKKSAYSLGWIKEFIESEHQNAGNETLRMADGEDSSEVTDASY